jgi:hypothetical protein
VHQHSAHHTSLDPRIWRHGGIHDHSFIPVLTGATSSNSRLINTRAAGPAFEPPKTHGEPVPRVAPSGHRKDWSFAARWSAASRA